MSYFVSTMEFDKWNYTHLIFLLLIYAEQQTSWNIISIKDPTSIKRYRECRMQASRQESM